MIAGLAAAGYAAPAYAQVSDEDLAVDVIEDEETVVEDDSEGDQIVVTGSRVKRDTFSSISPLQVITTDLSQDIGIFDPANLLQRNEAASGQQIDGTFQGFVLDNGPGSQTLSLRGLGANRTLLLINGRRMAPAGVEGAPSSPSINLIPGSLVERYDLLLDGASSAYGSDAVAGVGNIILKNEFDGLELFTRGNVNENGGNTDFTVSGTWGKNFENGFIGFGAEFDYRDAVDFADRDFLAGCDTHYEITQGGEIRTLGIADNIFVQNRTPGVGVSDNDCKIGGISGRIFSPFQRYGSVYFTEGPGNSGIIGYNESTAGGVDIDADGDGIRDVDFQDVNTNGLFPNTNFIPEQRRFSIMTLGEYEMGGEMNVTPYFELLYTRADIESGNAGSPQIFPTVPGSNEFNPCNLNNNDCAAAEETLLGVPGFNSGFSLPVIPIFAVEGDRNNFDVAQEQTRIVGGVKGDLPMFDSGPFSNWTFDLSGSYTRSEGNSVRNGVREDKLAFALGIDPSADFDGDGIIDNNGDGLADDYNQNVFFPPTVTPCDASGLRNPGSLLSDVTQGCVPVNLFTASVLGQPIGNFETQAERDYLFGTREFNTVYEQTILSGFITGEVYQLPSGPISAVLGFEHRTDEIDSSPNAVASNGLFFGFSADRGAVGKKSVSELFGELNLPLIANQPLFQQLEVNLSGRILEEEFYGFGSTYSLKGGWRPFKSLLFKGSYGTSFRAPNLRENFLAGASGFVTVVDPCALADDVFQGNAEDTRDQTIIDNCIREGRDPFLVGVDTTIGNSFTQANIEVSTGGSLDLDEETSTALTYGVAWEQPFTDAFDLNLNVNYYDIKIKGSVIEPSAQFLVNDCFTRDDGIRSNFCDAITFSRDPNSRLLITSVNAGFVNQDEERAKGIDYNAFFGTDFKAFGKNVDFGLNVRANKVTEISDTFVDDAGNVLFDDDVGEFGNPEWSGTGTATFDVDRFRFTWSARYIDAVSQEEEGIDEFSDALDSGNTGFFSDTCAGPAFGDVLCRDVGFADDVWTHNASIRYRDDLWTIRAGVANVFDRNPPRIDTNEVFGISNTPIGSGYDLNGREYFAAVSRKF